MAETNDDMKIQQISCPPSGRLDYPSASVRIFYITIVLINYNNWTVSKDNQRNKKKEQMGKNQRKRHKYQMEILTQQKKNTANQIGKQIYWDSPETKNVFGPTPQRGIGE